MQKKRSIRVSGHDTSVTMEEPFWAALRSIAAERSVSLNRLVSDIDARRDFYLPGGGLSSVLRVYILQHYQGKSGDLAQ